MEDPFLHIIVYSFPALSFLPAGRFLGLECNPTASFPRCVIRILVGSSFYTLSMFQKLLASLETQLRFPLFLSHLGGLRSASKDSRFLFEVFTTNFSTDPYYPRENEALPRGQRLKEVFLSLPRLAFKLIRVFTL